MPKKPVETLLAGAPAPRGEGAYTDELLDLDRRLVDLLARRSRLMGEAAAARRARGKPLGDPARERRLRAQWDRLVHDHGLDVRGVRRLLDMANALAYGLAAGAGKAMARFEFRPTRGAANLEALGPRSTLEARCYAALAAAAGAPLDMEPVVLSDPLVELVKAFNQVGADMSWERRSVVSPGGPGPVFAGRTVFAGSDALNFYILLAQSLPQVGTWTCTGSAELKALELGPATRLLASLGVRLTTLEPYSSGLPVRLESGGLQTGRACLADDVPPELALALCLAAPNWPQGLGLEFGPAWPGRDLLEQGVAVLAQCGATARLDRDGLSVPGSALRVPRRPDLALDPVLCAYLLAMPVLRGGRVLLSGRWPGNDSRALAARRLLASAGLDLTLDENGASAQARGRQGRPVLDCGGLLELLPLAAALAAAASDDVGLIALPDQAGELDTARELLARLGRRAEPAEGAEGAPGGWTVTAAGPDEERGPGPWAAPGPLWIMAAALAALARPGMQLSNPGDLALLWPGFWKVYTRLFGGAAEQPETKEAPGHESGKGRRIRLR